MDEQDMTPAQALSHTARTLADMAKTDPGAHITRSGGIHLRAVREDGEYLTIGDLKRLLAQAEAAGIPDSSPILTGKTAWRTERGRPGFLRKVKDIEV